MQKLIKRNFKSNYWQFLYTFYVFSGTYKLKVKIKKGLEFLYFAALATSLKYTIWLFWFWNKLKYYNSKTYYKKLVWYNYYGLIWKNLNIYINKNEKNFFIYDNILKKVSVFFILSKQHLRLKKKKRKKSYVICIKRTKNNFFFTLISLISGKVICKSSAGCCGIKTKKLKKARETINLICEKFAKLCQKKNIFHIIGFYVNQIKLFLFMRLMNRIRSIFWKQKIRVGFNLWLFNKKPHNGLRLKKLRRL